MQNSPEVVTCFFYILYYILFGLEIITLNKTDIFSHFYARGI